MIAFVDCTLDDLPLGYFQGLKCVDCSLLFLGDEWLCVCISWGRGFCVVGMPPWYLQGLICTGSPLFCAVPLLVLLHVSYCRIFVACFLFFCCVCKSPCVSWACLSRCLVVPGKYLLEGCALSSALLDFVALKRCHQSVVTLCFVEEVVVAVVAVAVFSTDWN